MYVSAVLIGVGTRLQLHPALRHQGTPLDGHWWTWQWWRQLHLHNWSPLQSLGIAFDLVLGLQSAGLFPWLSLSLASHTLEAPGFPDPSRELRISPACPCPSGWGFQPIPSPRIFQTTTKTTSKRWLIGYIRCLQSTLHTLHTLLDTFLLHTLHSTASLYSALHILNCTLYTPDSPPHRPFYTLHDGTPRSAFPTPTLHTLHFSIQVGS